MTQSTIATDNSFLARCIQDLKPENFSTYSFQSSCWTVAAGVAFVAFTALAVSAFIYANLFFPIYAPFVALGSLFLAMPASEGVKGLLKFSTGAWSEACRYQSIQTHFNDLSRLTPTQIQGDLSARGINWLQIPGINGQNISTLNPILAQARHLESELNQQFSIKQKLTEEARTLANTDFAANRQEVYNLRSAALFAEDRGLQLKIQAAFTNAVLRKGNTLESLEDICTLTTVSYHERVLGDDLNERTGVINFVAFKNRSLAPITHADVKRLSVPELGQRLVAAMR